MNFQRQWTHGITTALVVLGLLVLGACANTPRERAKQAFSEWAQDSGQDVHEKMVERHGLYTDPGLLAYVHRVGARMSADLPYRFRFFILDTNHVLAYAGPGGSIYLSRGLLAHLDSEDELAAIIGHEIAHIMGKHAEKIYVAQTEAYRLSGSISSHSRLDHVRTLSASFTRAIVRGYSRKQELESDRKALDYLARAGYSARAMTSVLSMLLKHEKYNPPLPWATRQYADTYRIYWTHPDTDKRIAHLKARASRAAIVPQARRTRYFAAVNGMRMGAAQPLGAIKNRTLTIANPALRITLPKGWRATPHRDQILAGRGDKSWMLRLSVSEIKAAPTVRATFNKVVQADDNIAQSFRKGRLLRIPGYRAYTAIATEKQGGNSRTVRYILIYTQTRALVITATTTYGNYPKTLERALKQLTRSITPLKANQRPRLKARVLHVRTARPGDRYTTLARKSRGYNDAVNILRILNRATADSEPVPGRPIKLIQ